jgi:hypothetical protein
MTNIRKLRLELENNNTKEKALPTLIFFERYHADDTTTQIITALLPKLKELGYTYFYEEAPQGIVEEDYFKKKENPYIPLMAALKTNKIKYKSIDLAIRINLEKGLKRPFPEQEQEITDALMPLRDQHFCHQYLTTSDNVFGRLGLGHAKGLQKEFLKVMPIKEANDNFCFFDCYSMRNIPYRKYYETPLKITSIDVDFFYGDTSKVLDKIINIIINKQQEMNKSVKVPYLNTSELKTDYEGQAKKVIAECIPKLQLLQNPIRKQVLETILETPCSQEQQLIIDARIDLLDYIADLTYIRYGQLPYLFPHYLNILTMLIDGYLDVQLSAANKFITQLKNTEGSTDKTSPLTNSEIFMLKKGRLRSISGIEKHGIDCKIGPGYMKFFKPAVITVGVVTGGLTGGLSGIVVGAVASYFLPEAVNSLSKQCKRSK